MAWLNWYGQIWVPSPVAAFGHHVRTGPVHALCLLPLGQASAYRSILPQVLAHMKGAECLQSGPEVCLIFVS